MRYIILVILNLPIVLLAFINIVTQYKMRKIPAERFRIQIAIWIIILTVLISSFPLYNLIVQKPLLDSSELSLFDIVQTTTIIGILYVLNSQRQKTEITEKRLSDLHQELSIKLSKIDNDIIQ